MTKRAVLFYYLLMLALFGGGIAGLIHAGRGLEDRHAVSSVSAGVESDRGKPAPAGADARSPLLAAGLLALQIVVIVGLSWLCGILFRKIGQPAVMGEILAGILLGPSVLGAFSPGAMEALFPPDSLAPLKMLSQIGILTFMFLTGMELDTELVKKKAHAAVLVSHAGILVPYFLGTALSLVLFHAYAPAGVRFTPFALFMGISLSITAFPVLARILGDRDLTGTSLGATALVCAAADDVTAWALLAAVVAVASSQSPAVLALTLVWSAAFVLVMLLVIRPALPKMIPARGDLPRRGLLLMLVLLLGGAALTEKIGIHALFGAFLAGVICPDIPALRDFLEKWLGRVSLLLMPLFFAFSGLRTQVQLLNSPALWGVCLLIIAAAIFGKVAGTTAAARLSKMNWHDSVSLGVLMNTRGLMELIVLNIGYELGILSAPLFAMLVVMALVTTLMTAPALTACARLFRA